MAFAALPCAAATTKAKAKSATKAAAPLPDDLTAQAAHHVATCPQPKVSRCVLRKPLAGSYRVLTAGVDIEDQEERWIVDFGKGPKGPKFVLQVLELGGALHDIEVTFRGKPPILETEAPPAK
jgi:hypothetical protein